MSETWVVVVVLWPLKMAVWLSTALTGVLLALLAAVERGA